MHVIVTCLFVVAFFIFGNFRDMKKYEATIMYVIIVNLFYMVLCANYWMWQYKPHLIPSQILTDSCYTFFVLPITTYLFLKYAPKEKSLKKISGHIFRWSICYFFTEWIYVEFDAITYSNGWDLFWSGIFYIFMFPLLYIHSKNRLMAYIISIIFVIILIIQFKVPYDIPIENR